MYFGITENQKNARCDQRSDCTLHSVMGEHSAVSGTPDSNYISILSTVVSYSMKSSSIRINGRVPSHIFDVNVKQHIRSDPFISKVFMF
jgi:hypothetical protein